MPAKTKARFPGSFEIEHALERRQGPDVFFPKHQTIAFVLWTPTHGMMLVLDWRVPSKKFCTHK
jgi:hypothetical protein